MTKQSMVVTGAGESRIDMESTVMISRSTLFSKLVPASTEAFVAVSRTTLLKKLETSIGGGADNGDGGGGGGDEVNAWVDSMRASSPTHVKSTSSFSENEEIYSWMIHHPSALKMFKNITKASIGKQIVMFLDYDGTLSPIVENPDRAFMSNEMRAVVRDVARYFPTAVVSGRCRDKVYKFVKLGQLYYAGSHGMDIKGPVNGHKYKKGIQPVLFQPAREFLPMVEEVYKILVEKTKSIEGANVENNKFCVSVHFRCVEESRWAALADLVRLVLDPYPKLVINQGRKVFEIRPAIKWDKGKALEFLIESLGYANSNDILPIYIGDDQTDEDAFKVLRNNGRGFGILVTKFPKETSASYSLQDPSEVKEFLQRMVEWKRSP